MIRRIAIGWVVGAALLIIYAEAERLDSQQTYAQEQ